MHTPELSDEELDALFRQGAEHYPDELNLGAWSRMEQKLDAAHVQQLVNRKVARLFAAEMAVVALVLLIWAGYRQYTGSGEPEAAARTAINQPSGASTAHRVGQASGQAPNSRVAAADPTRISPAAAVPGQAAAAVSMPDRNATAEAAETETGVSAGVGAKKSAQGIRVRPGLGLAPAAVTIRLPEPGQAAEASDAAAPRHTRRTQAAWAAAREQFISAAVAEAVGQERGARRKPGNRTKREQGAVSGTAAVAATSQQPAVTRAAMDGRKPAARVALEGPTSVAANSAPDQPAAKPMPGQESTSASAQAATSAGPEAAVQETSPASAAANEATAAGAAETLATLPTALLTEAEALPEALMGTAPVRPRRPSTPSRVFITGLYAPELSTVHHAGFTRPGRSAGIQVEYLLTPRLRVSVGLLSSMKYYYAHGSDYTFAWPPSYPVERIDAACRITDIPVNLRFDVWQGVRGRVFGSAGASSLLMRDELYKYTYRTNGYIYSRSWGVKNGKNHPFSVVNISAGYEYQLSPRWSAQAEPFLKLPLGGVGAGSVRLSSGGVFLGLKYGL
ncbi:hypothetical protein [Hymenobacter sp. CRA2]|uniref:hypothetical protein n=1 Tax=Hymenobacter sp. CRA2 TaxID=1955620 RepID=UPI00098FCCBF|nr:hypothetical protein [Hymenobacter sp. CRA2]OON67953.1 hypothetical protein B0919_14885 [Hymenobacter sp. CRA2]